LLSYTAQCSGPCHQAQSSAASLREILDLIARGLANPEITRRLVLSPKTSKLQARDRSQAIVQAREAGFGMADTND